MGRLTTHVLDTALGRPAKGMALALYSLGDSGRVLIVKTATNDDGRCAGPLLDGPSMASGVYELEFAASEYFSSAGVGQPSGVFLTDIVLRFTIDDPAQHYHVPLLVSPYGYSTYRGS